MSIVYFQKTKSRTEFVTRILRFFNDDLRQAKSYLIKPNIVSSEPYPTTTHPEVLDAVLSFLSNKEVVVADGPAFDAGSANSVLGASPLKEICQSHRVPFINLHTTRARRFRTKRGYRLKIFTLPFEVDFVISLPVLKVHGSTQITNTLKNQFGYLTNFERILMHMGLKNIDRGIAELNVVAKPNLFIVDAVQTLATRQEIRHGGKIKDLGYMIAGTDPVSLDCFGVDLLKQIEPQLADKASQDILHIRYASEYGVGSLRFKKKEL